MRHIPIDFLLTAKRDFKAALRFLHKAIGQHGAPEKITIDKSDANFTAFSRRVIETVISPWRGAFAELRVHLHLSGSEALLVDREQKLLSSFRAPDEDRPTPERSAIS